MVEGGQLLDLTGQEFLKNYDQDYLMTWGSYQGKVYTISGGSFAFTGVFYNKDLFEQYGVEIPTTWSEFVQACETFKANNVECLTTGAKDVWPLMVAGWGVQQAIYPDTEQALQGLWTGETKFNDDQGKTAWERMQQLLTFFEPGVTGIDNVSAPGRFASGKVAMYPAGTWDAPSIELANPDLDYGYFPIPGSDNPEDNQYLGVKSDSSFSIAGNSKNKEAALLWLEYFSQPEVYSEYVNAVGVLPAQPNATLTTKMGQEIAPYLPNLTTHLSVVWVSPPGVGANMAVVFNAALFDPFGTFSDAAALADQVQADWEAGLNAAE
jgi:raffinose/stachyose/melibiose transport system substrate-binding protein